MTCKRNAVADQVVAILRSANTTYLSQLADESEITRGPADVRLLENINIKEQRVLVDVGADDMEPVTISGKIGHYMVVFVLVVRRGSDRLKAMEKVIELATEVEDAVLADRTLDGEVHECHNQKLLPGYYATETDFLAGAQLELRCDFQTT